MLERMDECDEPITESDIDRAQQEIGVVFPARYRAFLLRYNGGRPRPGAFPIVGMPNNPCGLIQEFLGIDTPIESSSLTWNYSVFRGRVPHDLIPIARTGTGELICLSFSADNKGSVFLWDMQFEHSPPSYSNVYFIASSFDELIQRLFEDPEE